MGSETEEYKNSNSTGPGDKPAKMVRAEKEGAAIGPVHGSLRRYKTPVILSERELKV